MEQLVAKNTIVWYRDGLTVRPEVLAQIGTDVSEIKVFRAHNLTNDSAEYQQIFSVDADEIYGIVFSGEWIRRSGNINVQLLGMETGLFEFLCRLVKEAGRCSFFPAEQLFCEKSMQTDTGGIESEEHIEELAFTYAYTVRYHMNYLHSIQVMDSVFRDVCGLMQRKESFERFQHYMNFFLTNQKEYDRIAVDTAPFLVLRGDDTCGGVLQQFADDLTEALAANGQAVMEIGENDSDYERVQGILSKGVIGFQTRALEIDFFHKIRGPKFQFWLDNPLRFRGVLRNLPEEYYVLCQDADHAELIRRYYHTSNAIQFPPGGIEMPYQVGERPYNIVFIGNYFPDEGDALTGEQRLFYEYMIQHPQLTFEQGYKEIRNEQRDEALVQKMEELKPACRAIIGYFRNKVITTILDADIDLHVYGDSWMDAPYKAHTNLTMHPQISMKDSMKEFQKAKIGLNIMSWYKAGMTERIANIMLAGAVCLSDETVYLKENLEDGEEALLYRLDRLNELPGLIRNLLRDACRREQIARNGYEKAASEFSWKIRAKQLIELAANGLNHNTIQIFVATHVAFSPPDDPIYIPLHVGRSGKPDLGYLGDDSGENISDLNFLYGELTGLYWIWQNVEEPDYVGLCHYRRYFINERMQVMRKEEYLSILGKYDAIVPKAMKCDDGCTYYEQFGRAHNIHDLDAVERALKKLYPEYANAYDQVMQGHIFYWGNLVVTKLSILKSYAEWLFNIFVETGEDINVSGYDAYHKRVYGFLSEQMFYVFALANHLTLCETAVGISAEKAETRALKDVLKELMVDNRFLEARELLKRRLKERPDLLLSGSDVNHELKDIYDRLEDQT